MCCEGWRANLISPGLDWRSFDGDRSIASVPWRSFRKSHFADSQRFVASLVPNFAPVKSCIMSEVRGRRERRDCIKRKHCAAAEQFQCGCLAGLWPQHGKSKHGKSNMASQTLQVEHGKSSDVVVVREGYLMPDAEAHAAAPPERALRCCCGAPAAAASRLR